MPRGPKKLYVGRGGHIQMRVSDDEHRDLLKSTQAAGFENYADYLRHLIAKNSGHQVPVPASQDPIRPENRNAHKRLEALLNRLSDDERDQLWRILDAAFPVPKGRRAQ